MKERCFLKSQSILNLIALKNFLQLIHGTESRLVDNCKALEQDWQNALTFRAESGAVSPHFVHIPMQQGTETVCKDSQSLTEVYGSCEVVRNDASCNEVIQSKEVTSLGLEPRTYGLKVCCSTN